MQEKHQNKKKQLNTYLRFSSLTIQMGVIIFLGAFFGDFLDKKYNNNPLWFTIFLSLFAIASSLYYVFKKIKNED